MAQPGPQPQPRLSYPPLPGPISGDNGIVNAPWAQWFRELWNRVGNSDALTNTELHEMIVQMQDTITNSTSTNLFEDASQVIAMSLGAQNDMTALLTHDPGLPEPILLERIATALDARVAALENLPLDTLTQGVSDVTRRMNEIEAFVLMGGMAPLPAGVAYLGLPNVFTVIQTISVPQAGNAFTVVSAASGPVGLFTVNDPNTTLGGGATFTVANTTTAVGSQTLVTMAGYDTAGNSVAGARFAAQFTSHVVGALSADFYVQTRNAGAMGERLRIKSDGSITLSGATGMGSGTINIPNGSYINGNQALSLGAVVANELLVGNTGAPTVLRSSLGTRLGGAPTQGDIWIEATGTSPARTATMNLWDGGARRILATITY